METLAVHSTEERRMGEQTRLDCLKTATERNKLARRFAKQRDLDPDLQ